MNKYHTKHYDHVYSMQIITSSRAPPMHVPMYKSCHIHTGMLAALLWMGVDGI